MWKILHGALPTGENLQKRGLLANTVCARCGDKETTMHLFLHCIFVQELWRGVPWDSTLDSSQSSSFVEELTLSNSRRNLPPTGVTINLFPVDLLVLLD